jgi:hypothetical protein
VVAWLAAVGVAWGLVGLPEQCTEITPGEAREAAVATVEWFERNQLDDGRWVYRYNIGSDVTDRSPHTVRHSGVTMALYQAREAGIDKALTLADRGTEWSLGNLHRARPADGSGDIAMVTLGREAPTGGAALLTAGLAIRHRAEGPSPYDDEMFAMGRFLVAMTEPSGAVLEAWDTFDDAPVPERYSLFFTGEAYFALALLAQVDPDGDHGDWAGTADRIGTYLATERDEAEDRFPPTSDHWASYGLAASARAGLPLDDDQADYAERLGEIFGMQVRYESQRTGEGLNRWVLRGPEALGAGVGTLGEGLGGLWRLSEPDGVLADERDVIGERLRCVAGVLHDRQIDAAEAVDTHDPGLTEGAWFRLDWTQKDDQQHALSALLFAEDALAEGDRRVTPTGDDSVARVLWLLVIAAALTNPVRVRRLTTRGSGEGEAGGDDLPQPGGFPSLRARLGIGMAGTFSVLGAIALVGDPVLEAVDVSAPTGMIAAGVLVGLTAVVDFVRPKVEPLVGVGPRAALFVPLLVPGLLRPATAVAVLAVSSHVGVGAALGMSAVAAGAGVAAMRPAGDESTTVEKLLWQALAALAVAGGVALTVDGIFSI